MELTTEQNRNRTETEQKRQILCDMLKGGKGEVMGVITPMPADQARPSYRYYFLWRKTNKEEITKYCFDTTEEAEQMLRWFRGETTIDV